MSRTSKGVVMLLKLMGVGISAAIGYALVRIMGMPVECSWQIILVFVLARITPFENKWVQVITVGVLFAIQPNMWVLLVALIVALAKFMPKRSSRRSPAQTAE